MQNNAHNYLYCISACLRYQDPHHHHSLQHLQRINLEQKQLYMYFLSNRETSTLLLTSLHVNQENNIIKIAVPPRFCRGNSNPLYIDYVMIRLISLVLSRNETQRETCSPPERHKHATQRSRSGRVCGTNLPVPCARLHSQQRRSAVKSLALAREAQTCKRRAVGRSRCAICAERHFFPQRFVRPALSTTWVGVSVASTPFNAVWCNALHNPMLCVSCHATRCRITRPMCVCGHLSLSLCRV